MIQNIRKEQAIVERMVTCQPAGTCAAGAAFTLADVVLGLSTNRWLMTPMQRPALPAVNAWFARLRTRPGFLLHGDNGMP